MVANKHISKIIIAVMAVAVALCFLAIAFSDTISGWFGGNGVTMEYESKLFNTDEIISIDIQIDEDDWSDLLANAISEEYYVCDVTINGTTVKNVAIRPKGNTSLSSIAMDPDTDRYSLKLEFDHYVEGQTCYGLDKLILNNNFADATNMKEAIVYDMYQYLGVDASLYNYAKVSVNGEYWGVYLALEGVEESFMLRNFGTQDGELYKPDSMEVCGDSANGQMPSGMDMSDVDLSQFAGQTPPNGFNGEMPDGFDMSNLPDKDSFDPNNMPDREASGSEETGDGETTTDKASFSPSGMGGPSNSKGGANLNYIDDELDSYSTIWEGEITETGKSDRKRVVTALKNISEGTDLEKYLDVDNILKYMAVHAFAVNMDSLSGTMAHNYYLYEYDGQLNLFPWDYNLSFGGMGSSGDASSVINDAIDTPFSGTNFFDALLENEEYLAKYHEYLRQLVDEYVNGGRFDEVYSRIRSQIDSLVETDPTAFYTADEYNTAAEMLYKVVKLRAESISGQLDGTIPSTDDGQRADSSNLVDSSGIDIKIMGEFAGGGNDRGNTDSEAAENTAASNEEQPTQPATEETAEPQTQQNAEQPAQDEAPSGMPEGFDPNNMPEGFQPNNMPSGGPGGTPPDGFNGEMPENFDPNSMPSQGGNGAPPNMGSFNPFGNSQSGEQQQEQPAANDSQSENSESSDSSGKQNENGRPDFSGMPSNNTNSATVKNLITIGICLAVMTAVLVIIMFIKRRK